ncbi:right-handed parallel beta-helix repeat-containing protein [Nocardiopsis potens]|uniref:right-handed parallel beta-helix repeat-containing protein n=1 Tax=Nocardiopsis potens TaxID=1246458 RepID=UPI0012693876|nr:right-handed parallel beta-helix repeat-containing protein [Nocardiopsis potens]
MHAVACRLVLQGCAVTGGGVRFHAAEGAVRGSRIAGRPGVLAEHIAAVYGARVTVEDTGTEGSGRTAVTALENASVLVLRSRLEGGMSAGRFGSVEVRESSIGGAENRFGAFAGQDAFIALQDSTVSAPAGYGLQAERMHAQIRAVRVRLEGFRQGAVTVGEHGYVSLDDCRVRGAGGDGVTVGRGGGADLTGSWVGECGDPSDPLGSGVRVQSGGWLRMNGTAVSGNRGSGVTVHPDGRLEAARCRFEHNARAGVIGNESPGVRLGFSSVSGNGAGDKVAYRQAALWSSPR